MSFLNAFELISYHTGIAIVSTLLWFQLLRSNTYNSIQR